MENEEIKHVASEVLEKCRQNAGLGLSTEIMCIPNDIEWFWLADDRHQHYEERVKGPVPMTLTIHDWIMEYARRSSSIWGSAVTIPFEDDDGIVL